MSTFTAKEVNKRKFYLVDQAGPFSEHATPLEARHSQRPNRPACVLRGDVVKDILNGKITLAEMVARKVKRGTVRRIVSSAMARERAA